MNPLDLIDQTRANLLRAQQSYSDEAWATDRIRKPLSYYLTLDFRFNRQLKDQRTLLEKGRVVWGSIIQANTILFERRGAHGCLPADVMYCADESLDDDPEQLRDYAENMFELKGEEVSKEMQQFSRKLANEISGGVKLEIPTGFTDGHPCFMATILIARQHLACGYLADSLFPVLIHPEATKATMILPKHYWADELIAFWEE